MKLLHKKFLRIFSSGGGLISIETRTGLDKLERHGNLKNLIYLPNGLDGIELDRLFPSIKKPVEKQKIIITAGRIGSTQKNSRMLMEALKAVDLRDWKAYFIGPVEKSFGIYIDSFFRENPHLREKVFFTGYLKDRIELYAWYDRASVFCLTSLWESFGFVLAEAAYFGDYIISTRTGAACDIIIDGISGKIIEPGDTGGLIKALADVINGETGLDVPFSALRSVVRENFLWDGITGKLHDSITSIRGNALQ